jgi:hypothetical protein
MLEEFSRTNIVEDKINFLQPCTVIPSPFRAQPLQRANAGYDKPKVE